MNRFFTLLLAASCLTAVGQVPDYVPTEGLVAWYPFNGNAADESGNGNDGVISGAMLTSNRFDEPNSSFYFNGSAYIEVANSASISIPTGHDISWSVWLLSEPHSSEGSAFEKWDNSGITSYSQLMLRRNANGDEFVSAGYCANPAQAGTGVVSTEVSSSVWNHLVLVTENLGTHLYLNGELISTGSVEDVGCSNTEVLHIGRRPESSGRYYKGKIDDFAIWNRALGADEVASLYSLIPPSYGCTEESACNFDPEATVDDGTCEVPGCTDSQACNFTMDALCDGGICDYSCCPGPGCCGEGMFWDWGLGECAITNPSDSDFDGCVQLNDLLDLLSAYGDCGAEESPWQCGDPLEYQGYDYETVQIGEQCWFAENCRYMPFVVEGVVHPTDAAIMVQGYQGDSLAEALQLDNYIDFGALYNYQATEEIQLCPNEWHIPSDSEYQVLEISMGMPPSVASETFWRGENEGAMLKSSSHWNGADSNGFNALPAGTIGSVVDDQAYFWTSSSGEGTAWHRVLATNRTDINRNMGNKQLGYSVRCIKD